MDAGIAAALAALHDHDDIVDDGIGAAVVACPPRRYAQRSREHVNHMVLQRLRRSKIGGVKKDLALKHKFYNDHHATRQREELPERVEDALAVMRPGRCRKWLPTAMLRSCFRARLAPSEKDVMASTLRARRRRVRHQQARHDAEMRRRMSVSATVANASRANVVAEAIAEDAHASGAHVGYVRRAIADVCIEQQLGTIRGLEDTDVAAVELAFDETEMRLGTTQKFCFKRRRVVHKVRSVMMMHMVIYWATTTVQITLVPAVILLTTAANLWTALRGRVMPYLDILRPKLRSLVVVHVTDSAKACRKHFRMLVEIFKGFGIAVYLIQVLCVMHLLFLCINAVHKDWDIVGPLFCGTCLIHRGAVYDAFLRGVEAELLSRVEATTDPPTEADKAYLDGVVRLLRWETTWAEWFSSDGPRKRTTEYKGAVQEFRVLFTHLLSSGRRIRHYCPYGCCPNGRQQTIHRMMGCLVELFLGSLPPVPALNRWVKLFPCMLWWLLGLLIHDIGPSAWKRAQSVTTRGCFEERVFAAADLVEQGEDDTVRQINVSRNRRINRWLQLPETRMRLCALVLVVLAVFDVMSRVFMDGSLNAGPRMLAFIDDDGPPLQLIRYYLARLNDLDGSHWVLLRAADGWTPRKLQMVTTMTLMLVGHLQLRLVTPFLMWPWPLRKTIGDRALTDGVGVIAALAHTCDDCLDKAFTLPLVTRDRGEVRKNPRVLLDARHPKARIVHVGLRSCGAMDQRGRGGGVCKPVGESTTK